MPRTFVMGDPQAPFAKVMEVLEWHRALAKDQLAADVMLISIVCGTAFLLVPRHGALGLAIAYLAGFACTSAALALYVHSARARSMEVPTCEEFS